MEQIQYLNQVRLMKCLKLAGFPCSHHAIKKWREEGMPVASYRPKRYLWDQVEEWLLNRKKEEK